MSEALSLTEAQSQLGSLVRRASTQHERITITDHGHPAAVLISPQELADLEDELAVTRNELGKAAGTLRTIPHQEVRDRLGLKPA